ncbi:putative ribonuclease H-like domain-containing protein [Tanacetum coccineum]
MYGSLCLEGSGVRLILTNPEGVEFTYALRFEFDVSNNEAEYEALMAGLRIAEQMGVQKLIVKVPRSENKKADAPSKIASTSFAHLTKQVLVEVLKEKSIEEREILAVVEKEGYLWMTPLFEYLTDGTLPAKAKKVRAIKIKARQYAVIRGVLCRKSFWSLGYGASVHSKQNMPPMLEKGNYIPWESRFRRFRDNKLEDGKRMWNSIQNRPYKRPMIPNPDNDQQTILEPLSKMTEGNKKQYIADVKVVNYLLQAILNDIYNSVDASKEGESLKSVYERLTTLVNIMNRNNVHPIPVSINTKFLNCLQPEWSKYVTMVRHNQTRDTVSYDVLYDSLVQFEPHVLASKAKKAAKNYDPLALLVYSNASSSHSHANSSYSPQPYYVTHPSSVVDYKDEYQGELQGDSQEDKLTSSNIRNQARVPRTESTLGKANVQCYNCNEKGHYARDYQKPRMRDAKYFREQMLLALKDEAGSNLNNKENDFMIDSSYGDETMEELTAAVMLMARIQPADGNTETVPSYDAKAVNEVNALSKVHEQVSHVKRKTIIQTSDDDQIDSNIIFDNPYVENNGGMYDHDSNAHNEYHEIQKLAYNVKKEAENQKRLNNDIKKQKMLLQKELET